MAADGTAQHADTRAAPTPVGTRGCGVGSGSLSDLLVRQLEAVDRWVAARRDRERVLEQCRTSRMSRDQRADADRQVHLLRRTHDSIRGHCARGLATAVGPLPLASPTAVIVHRNAWFSDQVSRVLIDRGVTVAACTDNGAEALGVVVAEQPDLVLVGDRIAMMPSCALLAEVRLFAGRTLRVVHASDRHSADLLRPDAHAVLLRHHAPSRVVDALAALYLRAAAQQRRASDDSSEVVARQADRTVDVAEQALPARTVAQRAGATSPR